jgi:hypothetical protein
MAEQITIPISAFELTVWFKTIAVRMLADRAQLVQSLFDSFAQFKPAPDDLEAITTGKTSELGVRLRLASRGITLFFGAASCKITKDAATWPEADATLAIIATFLEILVQYAGVELGRKNTIISIHVQPKTKSFKEILSPFVDERLKKIGSAPLDAMAVVARWPGRRLTLDGSAQLVNGIFIQMEREFAPEVSFEQIKKELFDDELNLLKLLDLAEVEA